MLLRRTAFLTGDNIKNMMSHAGLLSVRGVQEHVHRGPGGSKGPGIQQCRVLYVLYQSVTKAFDVHCCTLRRFATKFGMQVWMLANIASPGSNQQTCLKSYNFHSKRPRKISQLHDHLRFEHSVPDMMSLSQPEDTPLEHSP